MSNLYFFFVSGGKSLYRHEECPLVSGHQLTSRRANAAFPHTPPPATRSPYAPTAITLHVHRAMLVTRPRSSLISMVQTSTVRPW